MKNRYIRVLHSVSPAQTYVLSRSPSPVQIYPINENSIGNSTQFASASIKSCIDIIYNSSPELFNNSKKDFSVYSLDPLESLASVASTSTSLQTVSVACGRISAIRASNGHSTVTGTLVKDRVGQEALQVVFVLCETPAIYKVPDSAAAGRISAALARQMEESDRAQRRKQREMERLNSKPAPTLKTEADRILEASGDLCLIQPAGPSLALPKPFAYRYSSSQTSHSTSASNVLPIQNAHAPLNSQSAQASSSSVQEISSQNLSSELLSILEAAKNNPQVNREALLRVISFIDSATKQNTELTIADALRKLAPSQAPVTLPQAPQTPPRTPPAPTAPTSPDDTIVILDKENVNPSAFRRRAERGAEEGKSLATLSIDIPPLPQQQVLLASGVNQYLRPTTTFTNEAIPSVPSTRKRTLSEALDDTHSFKRNQERNGTFSSPPRSNRTIMSPGFSKDQPIVIPDSPSMPKPGGQRTQSRARLKMPYVVPDWARTQTALQPRLSEEALSMMKEMEQRKQEEKLAKRMKWSQQRKSGLMHRTMSTPAVFSSGADEPVASGSGLSSFSKKGPIAGPSLHPVPDLLPPVIAAAGTSISFPSSPQRTPSPSPMQPAPPQTPPRRRFASSSSSPEEEEFSLFTPRRMATPQKGPSVFESLTITQSPSIRPIHRREATPPPSSEPVAAEDDTASCQGDDSDDENFLTQELNSAMEETEISAILPVKRSDKEMTDSRDDVDAHIQDEDEEDEEGSDKPFWPGLPPSSPPPQSSPMLQPTDDLEDDFELPTVSSDFDIEDFPPKTEQIIDSENVENTFSDVDHEVNHFDDTALAAILEMLTNSNNVNSGSPFIADNSDDIFKDLGAVVDETGQSQHVDTAHRDSLLGFPSDITLDNPGFWSAVGPLLDQIPNTDTVNEGSDPIQNLLSGCVL
ncbi:protein [Lentinula edodes]|uniref:Protein n=1 Tax=Lentinula edodes TaxID=5353 RepID=A0A1Q3EEM4_LENED|nr:protein [Lentinula edodes]